MVGVSVIVRTSDINMTLQPRTSKLVVRWRSSFTIYRAKHNSVFVIVMKSRSREYETYHAMPPNCLRIPRHQNLRKYCNSKCGAWPTLTIRAIDGRRWRPHYVQLAPVNHAANSCDPRLVGIMNDQARACPSHGWICRNSCDSIRDRIGQNDGVRIG